MRLYGLKDERGNDVYLQVELIKDDGLYWKLKNIVATGEDLKLWFRVGDWVIARCNEVNCDYLIRLSEIDPIRSKYWKPIDSTIFYERLGTFDAVIRLATKEEIETHLKSIADEKYFNKTALCLEHGDHRRVLNKYTTYYKDVDELVTLGSVDGHTCNVWLYKDGKWAEIIPEKKKLPKTKEEFNLFLGAWANRHTHSTQEFLDQYEY